MEYPELARFIEVVAKLRDPKTGCSWDLKQNHASLTRYTIEEAFEYVHAVESKDKDKIEEELGDVLLQVVLNSQIAKDEGSFDIESVAKKIADKMVYRHPHVFDNPTGKQFTPEEITTKWEELKGKETKKKYYFNTDETYMPALMAADKIGKKSKKVNFDWEDYQQVLYKVEEEWQEVKEELPVSGQYNKDRVKEEIGDLLFSVAQLARHMEIDPEDCLKQANIKFIKRFNKIEDTINSQGRELNDMSQAQLEKIWISIK